MCRFAVGSVVAIYKKKVSCFDGFYILAGYLSSGINYP